MRNDPKTGIGDPEDRTVLSAQLGRTPSQELSSHSGAFQCELHRYDAGAKLGAGGMAAVFRAVDKITGAEVALKIIDNTDDDMARRARFEREVRAAGRLVHPNVCRVLSFGKAPAKLFMTMELVEGVTLQRVIKSRGSLPVPIALEALRQLLGALGCAHDHGVVHRDLKPANVMITPQGVLKLLDFGIAKSQEDATVTATGLLIGTPAFMSPEQIMGGTVDGRSDLFAAGVTLLVMLTGRTRFSGLEPAAVMVKVSSEPVGSLIEECPAASAPVDRFLAKLCAQKQENRFQTAQEALQALEQLAEVGDEESGRALLASYVQTPDEVATAIAQASAEIELRRADELLRAGPPAQPAAALCLYRASLLQPSEEIRGRLAALCARANITFEPVHDAAISEAMAAFEKTPAAAGVLKRLADLYRARGQVILAAAFLQRYLRVKPTDSVAQQQLNVLLDGPERTQLGGRPASKDTSRTGERLRTRDIVAGIKTGGHVDPAQAVRPGMAVDKAPAPPTKHVERDPRPAPPTRLVPADEPRRPEPREPEPRPALAAQKLAQPQQSVVQRAQATHAAQPTGAAVAPQTQSGGPVTGQPRSAALSLLPHQPLQQVAGPASGTQRSGVQPGTAATGTGALPSVILAPTDDAAPRVRMHPLVTLFVVLLIAGVVVAFFGRFMTTTVDTAQQVMSDNEQSLGRFERNNEERQRINLLNRAKADFERANFSSTIRNTNELLARDPPADLALTALWLRAQSRIKLSDTQSAINDLERIVSEAPLKDGRRNDAKKLLDELYAKPNELIAPRGF